MLFPLKVSVVIAVNEKFCEVPISKGMNCNDLIKMFEYKLPVNGNDIMNVFNIKPGPKIKEYLDKSLDIVFDNPYITKDEILNKLKEIKN